MEYIHIVSNNDTEIKLISNHSINIILRINKKATELIEHLHASCFSPSKHTLLKAITTNFFNTCPGLIYNPITKHLYSNINAVLGHIYNEKQGRRSTKLITTPLVLANKLICTLIYPHTRA